MTPYATFLTLPTDTANAAQASFGKGNLYLMIGDQLELIFTTVKFDDLPVTHFRRAEHPSLLALTTIFQFIEDLTDQQMAHATGTRLDLKYALHLPLNHPGFSAQVLCEFRQWLQWNPTRLQFLQHLFSRLNELSLLPDSEKVKATSAEILRTVCNLSRLERMADAVVMALETLASSHPEWLRKIALPTWYQRYMPKKMVGVFPRSFPEQETFALIIGSDMVYLLEKIKSAETQEFSLMPEIKELKKTFHEQFARDLGELHWRQPIYGETLEGAAQVG